MCPWAAFPARPLSRLKAVRYPPGQQAPRVLFNRVDPPYFQTLRIPLLGGRAFTDSDDATAPRVAIINQSMAQRFWPRHDPIGKRFSVDGDGGLSSKSSA